MSAAVKVAAAVVVLAAFAVAAGAVVWAAWELWDPLPRPTRTPDNPHLGAGNWVDTRSRRAQ